MRALAVLAVMAYHAGLPLPGGYLGVDVFFVISGFVITSLLLREFDHGGRIRLGRFYHRRLRRLGPPLVVVSCVTLALSAAVLSPTGAQQVAARTAAGAHLLVANVVVPRTSGGYFDPEASLNPFLHTWSLSVEEQVYLVLPVILLLVWQVTRQQVARRTALVLVLAAGTASLGVVVLNDMQAVTFGSGWFYSPFGRVWEFAAGAAIALATPLTRPRAQAAAGLCGIVMVVASLLVVQGGADSPGTSALPAVVGTGLVIASGGERVGAVHRWLSRPTMVRIGDLSYSLYLWHWPVIVIFSVALGTEAWVPILAVLLSIVPAIASFHLVEEPVRRGRALPFVPAPLLAALCTIPALVGAMVITGAAGTGYGDRAVLVAQTNRNKPADGVDACTGEVLCTIASAGTGRPVYLVGDSHAGHFSDAAIRVGHSLDRPVHLSMAYNCPLLVGLEVSLDGGEECADRNRQLMRRLEMAQAGTVVLSAADVYWSAPHWVVIAAESRQTLSTRARLPAWKEALTQTVRRLRQAGHDVVLVQSIPLQPQFDLDRCSMSDVRNEKCGRTVEVQVAHRTQGDAREAMAAVGRRTNTVVMDPWRRLCTERCSTGAGPYLYRNWSHLSVEGSVLMAPLLAAAALQAESGLGPPAGHPIAVVAVGD